VPWGQPLINLFVFGKGAREEGVEGRLLGGCQGNQQPEAERPSFGSVAGPKDGNGRGGKAVVANVLRREAVRGPDRGNVHHPGHALRSEARDS